MSRPREGIYRLHVAAHDLAGPVHLQLGRLEDQLVVDLHLAQLVGDLEHGQLAQIGGRALDGRVGGGARGRLRGILDKVGKNFPMRLRHLSLFSLTLLLCSCSSERVEVGRYLKGLGKDVLPAVEQGKVVGEVAKTMNVRNFKATWPIVRNNVEEMQVKLKAAQDDVKSLKVPPACNNLSRLVSDEMDQLTMMCDKGRSLGDQLASLGTDPHPMRKFQELRPSIEDWQQSLARQTGLKTKLELEIDDLKRKERL